MSIPDYQSIMLPLLRTVADGKEERITDETNNKTPEEELGSAWKSLNKTLATDILEKVKEISPAKFEQLVIDLLLAMGYGGSRQEAGNLVGRTGDGGIDSVINEDRLGLDKIYLQAKRWENTVPIKETYQVKEIDTDYFEN